MQDSVNVNSSTIPAVRVRGGHISYHATTLYNFEEP